MHSHLVSNNMVKINVIQSSKCWLVGPDDVVIGEIISEASWLDVRLQIKKQKLEGYYFIWPNPNGPIRIDIDKNGHGCWPDGFFDQCDEYYFHLVDWE